VSCKTIMIQGTASSVGKSILVTALCRIFRQDGLRVAPFKSQNMALNSFVTREGGEIGRAQAVQAEAAGIEPSVDMNPILLKPEANARSQVIVLGKVMKTLDAERYYEYTPQLMEIIRNSLNKLRSNYDVVVIEGAGSPAEINLKEREIVNMRIARMADAPVLLTGDIDRGGVFASLVGTLELLDPNEREMVRGFIINKFRGDVRLLKPGLEMLEKRTSLPVLGVIPYFKNIGIAQEDSVYLDERQHPAGEGLKIAVIHFPHISNYDDFDTLEKMGCRIEYITGPSQLAEPDLIILPGTKSTIADLLFMHRRGLDRYVVKLAHRGTPVIGVCGGFQIMGYELNDPEGIESSRHSIAGLKLLESRTVFQEVKRTTQVKARVKAAKGLFAGMQNLELSGYEIHMGRTETFQMEPAFEITSTPSGDKEYAEGAVNPDGMIFGTYLHGLFNNIEFTSALLENLRKIHGLPPCVEKINTREEEYNNLADLVRKNLDIPAIYKIISGQVA